MTTLNIMAMESGGYEYEFVHTPSDTLICQICFCPSKDPQLSVCCGHTFCKSCLEAADQVNCPMCRHKYFAVVPNKQTDRIIRSLHVYCSNKQKGCEWRGEVNAITSHLNNRDGCQFQEVDCPNNCGVSYQRQHLTSHVEVECPRRKVNCQLCHDTGEHQFIEGQHKEECPKLPQPCPNNCGVDSIPRDGLKEHTDICPLQLIQCKYHVVGCEAIMARKDQEKHDKEMIEEHLCLSANELATCKVSMKVLTQKLSAANNEIATLKHQLVTLTDYDNAFSKAEMKFQSAIEPELKLQPVFWRSYLDTIAAECLSGSDDVAPVVVKMSEFTNKKRHNSAWFSAPFYTQINGYKVQLKVIPNGDLVTRGFMTVAFYILKGPYDELLQWPMKGKCEVRLLNQNSDSMHHSVTCSINEQNSAKPVGNPRLPSWYSQKFIPHSNLTAQNGFLIDDNIYIQVCKPFY